jgi:hypothetical protein
MSYDVDIIDPHTKEVVSIEKKHDLRGGIFVVGGTRELTYNITYNYCVNYDACLFSIHDLNKKTIKETMGKLKEVEYKLQGKPDDNYWKSSDGNAKKAVQDLITLSELAPSEECLWSVN